MADPLPHPSSNGDPGGAPPTPRWVKLFVIIALVLILMVIFMILTGIGGEHGPGRHMPAGATGGDTSFIVYKSQPDGPEDYASPIEQEGQPL